MRFDSLVLAAPLALALLPAVAGAQPRPGGAPPPPASTAPVTDGVEIAVSAMMVAIFPAIGGQVSIPASERVRLEVGTHVVPWTLEDRDDLGMVTHVQARIPLRRGPPGSRRSLIVGASAFSLYRHVDSIDRWEFNTAVRPHAGVSWQWQKSRNIDVRIDLQGIFLGPSTPFVAPFGAFSMVWHRERRWS
jgi:hypothetical protein